MPNIPRIQYDLFIRPNFFQSFLGIYRCFATPEAVEAKSNQYLNGGLAYSDIKQELCENEKSTYEYFLSA
jgi:hypothetical protein